MTDIAGHMEMNGNGANPTVVGRLEVLVGQQYLRIDDIVQDSTENQK
jgi:hypothetical protein